MAYSVQIDRIGTDGLPVGRPAVQGAPSESEAITILRQAKRLARSLTQPMQFSVYGPGNRLVMSYTSEAAPEPSLGAVAP